MKTYVFFQPWNIDSWSWPWPLTPDLENPISNAHSHDEYLLCANFHQNLPLSKETDGQRTGWTDDRQW